MRLTYGDADHVSVGSTRAVLKIQSAQTWLACKRRAEKSLHFQLLPVAEVFSDTAFVIWVVYPKTELRKGGKVLFMPWKRFISRSKLKKVVGS